jgi:hypothetical protein
VTSRPDHAVDAIGDQGRAFVQAQMVEGFFERREYRGSYEYQ